MATQIVKSARDMARRNVEFFNKVKVVNTLILRDLAKANKTSSIKKALTVKFIGNLALISDIEISPTRIQVKTSQKAAMYAGEIEYGLKSWLGESDIFRSYDDFPKLKKWAELKLNMVPSYGLTVNTKALHFMENGLNLAYQESNAIVNNRLRRLA